MNIVKGGGGEPPNTLVFMALGIYVEFYSALFTMFSKFLYNSFPIGKMLYFVIFGTYLM